MVHNFEKIQVKTSYLEMVTPPRSLNEEVRESMTLERWENPCLQSYLDLYSEVGKKWGWSGRLIMDESEVAAIIHNPHYELYVLRYNATAIGLSELDCTNPLDIELVYLGLKPGYIGLGFGKSLLQLTLRQAWRHHPRRLWLHTCEYDHDSALKTYLKAGFGIYATENKFEYYLKDFLQAKSILRNQQK